MKIPLKKLLCCSAVLCSASMLAAGETALRLQMSDGSSATFVLSQKPVVTFDDNSMYINSSDVAAEYPRKDVIDLSFVDYATTAVIPMDGNEDVIRYTGRTVESYGNVIYVYDINGRATGFGEGKVDLSQNAPGIYIVKAGNQTLKIKI